VDSLNRLILSKEQEYNVIIANFERVVQQSMDLQGKLLESLSENERIEGKTNSYMVEYPTTLFSIHPLNKNLKKNQVQFVYLTLKEEVNISEDDYLSIAIHPKGRQIILLDKNYKLSSRFNKMSFSVTQFENYREYELEISYFKKEKNGYRKCYIVEEINLL
jgi:hypothetical protein